MAPGAVVVVMTLCAETGAGFPVAMILSATRSRKSGGGGGSVFLPYRHSLGNRQ